MVATSLPLPSQPPRSAQPPANRDELYLPVRLSMSDQRRNLQRCGSAAARLNRRPACLRYSDPHLDGQAAAARAEHVLSLGRLSEPEDADAVEILEALLEAPHRARLGRADRLARVVVLLVRLVLPFRVANLRLQVVAIL